jgi:hypothetical protein
VVIGTIFASMCGQGVEVPWQAPLYAANRGRKGAISTPERSPTGRPVA